MAALLERGAGTLGTDDAAQLSIFGLGGDDDHILEVLRTGTDERDAADVDLLDDVLGRSTAGHGLLERIEVDHHQVYLGYLVLRHLLAVALVVAARQYTSEHLRMERLHTATQDGGIGGHILHLLAFVALLFYKLLRAACRQEAHALVGELLQQLVESILVEHRD